MEKLRVIGVIRGAPVKFKSPASRARRINLLPSFRCRSPTAAGYFSLMRRRRSKPDCRRNFRVNYRPSYPLVVLSKARSAPRCYKL